MAATPGASTGTAAGFSAGTGGGDDSADEDGVVDGVGAAAEQPVMLVGARNRRAAAAAEGAGSVSKRPVKRTLAVQLPKRAVHVDQNASGLADTTLRNNDIRALLMDRWALRGAGAGKQCLGSWRLASMCSVSTPGLYDWCDGAAP
jgi:hypothetical protein